MSLSREEVRNIVATNLTIHVKAWFIIVAKKNFRPVQEDSFRTRAINIKWTEEISVEIERLIVYLCIKDREKARSFVSTCSAKVADEMVSEWILSGRTIELFKS
jgi:hypothetical protein